jgi:hypothetical protein
MVLYEQCHANISSSSSPLCGLSSSVAFARGVRHFLSLAAVATYCIAILLLLLHSSSLQDLSTTMSSLNNLHHMTESDVMDQILISGDAGIGAGGFLTATHATATLQQEDSAAMATADAFHDTMMNDDSDVNNHSMLPPPPPLTTLPPPKNKTAESSPELEAMIGGLRQELDAVIHVNQVETDRMFDEMVVFLEDSHAICTDTMLGHLDYETAEANRLTGMEPDVDAATVSLVGNQHYHDDGHGHGHGDGHDM